MRKFRTRKLYIKGKTGRKGKSRKVKNSRKVKRGGGPPPYDDNFDTNQILYPTKFFCTDYIYNPNTGLDGKNYITAKKCYNKNKYNINPKAITENSFSLVCPNQFHDQYRDKYYSEINLDPYSNSNGEVCKVSDVSQPQKVENTQKTALLNEIRDLANEINDINNDISKLPRLERELADPGLINEIKKRNLELPNLDTQLKQLQLQLSNL